jgi:hypothetical protein
MAKLPWYLKVESTSITNNGIKLNLKPYKIFIFWLKILIIKTYMFNNINKAVDKTKIILSKWQIQTK